MFSIAELMDTCFLPDGRYTLRIVEPKGTPAHEIVFQLAGGVYQAEVTTEHGTQRAKALTLGDRKISWQQLGGSPGTELFQYDMNIFPGGLLMGRCRRIDVPAHEAPPSPVIAERTDN